MIETVASLKKEYEEDEAITSSFEAAFTLRNVLSQLLGKTFHGDAWKEFSIEGMKAICKDMLSAELISAVDQRRAKLLKKLISSKKHREEILILLTDHLFTV